MSNSEIDKSRRELFGLTVLNNNHKDIRRLKRQFGNTELHGNKVWSSSCLLMDYLSCYPPAEKQRIVEVGSGWGLGGIYCAKHFGAEVTAVDADEKVFPYCELHATLNEVCIKTLAEGFEHLSTDWLTQFDLLIAADICFWDEMSQPLYELIHRCYQAGVSRVVIADPGRPPFREVAQACAETFDAQYEQWVVPHPYNLTGLVLDIG